MVSVSVLLEPVGLIKVEDDHPVPVGWKCEELDGDGELWLTAEGDDQVWDDDPVPTIGDDELYGQSEAVLERVEDVFTLVDDVLEMVDDDIERELEELNDVLLADVDGTLEDEEGRDEADEELPPVIVQELWPSHPYPPSLAAAVLMRATKKTENDVRISRLCCYNNDKTRCCFD